MQIIEYYSFYSIIWFIIINGFVPIALSSSGKQVYSLSAAAESTNLSAGRDKVLNASLVSSALGIENQDVLGTLDDLAASIGDPTAIGQIDQALSEGGELEAAQEIEKLLGIEGASLETREGQILKYGANQIGSLWGSLSVDQKTSALASLAPALVEQKTGQKISDQVVNGSTGAVGGELNVGQVSNVMSQGLNGMALARNWDQLSAFSSITSGNTDPTATAHISEYAGLLGFGAQGASVKLPNNYLENVGAKPAPAMGVGAAMFGTVEQVPSSYEIVGIAPLGDGVVALPANLRHTANKSFKQAGIISQRKHPAQKLWGDAPSESVRGAAGGSAMISGMNLMKDNNTVINSSMISYAMFANTMGK